MLLYTARSFVNRILRVIENGKIAVDFVQHRLTAASSTSCLGFRLDRDHCAGSDAASVLFPPRIARVKGDHSTMSYRIGRASGRQTTLRG